jgi:hypothetical protein
MFRQKPGPERRHRAEIMVRQMGYEFHVRSVRLGMAGRRLAVGVDLENRGVAPFYYDWPAKCALISERGDVVTTFAIKGKLIPILPDGAPRRWEESFDVGRVKAGRYVVGLQVPSPLPKGKPLRFANKEQDEDFPGWLTLGRISP